MNDTNSGVEVDFGLRLETKWQSDRGHFALEGGPRNEYRPWMVIEKIASMNCSKSQKYDITNVILGLISTTRN